jgi:hypothetical protein
MTGFNSKRQAAQAKLDAAADTLSIVYQRGFADGKRSVQRKPLTDEEIQQVVLTAHGNQDWTLVFARAIEAAHNIKE